MSVDIQHNFLPQTHLNDPVILPSVPRAKPPFPRATVRHESNRQTQDNPNLNQISHNTPSSISSSEFLPPPMKSHLLLQPRLPSENSSSDRVITYNIPVSSPESTTKLMTAAEIESVKKRADTLIAHLLDHSEPLPPSPVKTITDPYLNNVHSSVTPSVPPSISVYCPPKETSTSVQSPGEAPRSSTSPQPPVDHCPARPNGIARSNSVSSSVDLRSVAEVGLDKGQKKAKYLISLFLISHVNLCISHFQEN